MSGRSKIFSVLLIITAVLLLPVVCAGQQLTPNSRAAALIDVESGRILYQRILRLGCPWLVQPK